VVCRSTQLIDRRSIRALQIQGSDSNGNFWLFGGYGYDLGILAQQNLNDVWEYQPSNGPLPTTATPTLSLASGTYAAAQTLLMNDTTDGAFIFIALLSFLQPSYHPLFRHAESDRNGQRLFE
jgi:hypothetical protein